MEIDDENELQEQEEQEEEEQEQEEHHHHQKQEQEQEQQLQLPQHRADMENLCNNSTSSSSSRHVVDTVKGFHNLKIVGFSLAKGMGPGKFICSRKFSVAGFDWCIYFYPDGKNPEDNCHYVSVFVALVSDARDVRAKFELTLVDQSGRGRHKVHTHFHPDDDRGPYTLRYSGSMWGYKRFVRRASLESSDFMKDDTLEIHCTVGVVISETQSHRLSSVEIPEPNLTRQFAKLLENSENADVTFIVSGESFHAHRVLLAARSRVFKEMLLGPSKDCENRGIRIDNIKPEVFKAMLQVIYTDSLPELSPLTSHNTAELDLLQHDTCLDPMVEDLLDAACHYELCQLQWLLESKISELITLGTVAKILALAHRYQARNLKSVCLKFIAANLDVFMESEGYEYLKSKYSSFELDLLQTIAEEDMGDSS